MTVIAETIAQLKASSLGFRAIEGAAEFKALMGTFDAKGVQQTGAGMLRVSPSAFVVPLADVGLPSSEGGSAFIQRINPMIGVVIGLREASDLRGAAAAESIGDLTVSVRGALLGWTPASAIFPFEFVRGALQGFVKGTTWWMDEFRCGLQIRKT